MKEICICAAILCEDGQIIRGHRHADCLHNMYHREVKLKEKEQGFITSHNRFVGRQEGRMLQDEAGIPSADPEGYRGGLLFSEDLY